MSTTKENILLIHLFSNGDCLLATTVAKQIKNDFPSCKLFWAISSKCKAMIYNNPYVDEVLEIEISDASQNIYCYEEVYRNAILKKKEGFYSQIFSSQIIADNYKFYDGTVCSSIYRCFGKPITVDTTPVLQLTEKEKETANQFSIVNNLALYTNIVLFECAPQSNQLDLSEEIILSYCKEIIKYENTCVILSAPKDYNFGIPQIFDGSVLSIRETAALTHYCTLLLGCSSGISWIATTTAAKEIPTLQILSSKAYYFNPLSLTFIKQGRSTNHILELTIFDFKKLSICFADIFKNGFQYAREIHNQKIKKQYKLYRGITHKFLKDRKISFLIKFIQINFKENSFSFNMIKYIFLGFVLFPFQCLKELKNK
jgi:ADP-heptose:LPS heptosyltransferase